jgi:hypothetical protein
MLRKALASEAKRLAWGARSQESDLLRQSGPVDLPDIRFVDGTANRSAAGFRIPAQRLARGLIELVKVRGREPGHLQTYSESAGAARGLRLLSAGNRNTGPRTIADSSGRTLPGESAGRPGLPCVQHLVLGG